MWFCEMGNGLCFDFISGLLLSLVDNRPVQRGVIWDVGGLLTKSVAWVLDFPGFLFSLVL